MQRLSFGADYSLDMSSNPVSFFRHRPWLGIIALLVAIDCITVSALLSRNQRLLAISQDGGRSAQAWAQRVEELSKLRGLAVDLLVERNRNNVSFDKENASLFQAATAFASGTKAVRHELQPLMTQEHPVFEADLRTIADGANLIANHRAAAIRHRRDRNFEQALHEMAAAELAWAGLNNQLKEMEANIRVVHSAAMSERQDQLAGVRRSTIIIVLFNLLMVIACLLARTTAVSAEASSTSPIPEPAPARAAVQPRPAVAAVVPSTFAAVMPQAVVATPPPAAEGPDYLQEFPSEADAPTTLRRAG